MPHTDEIDRYEEQGNPEPSNGRGWVEFVIIVVILITVAIILYNCGG